MRFFSSLQVRNEDGGAELTVRRSSSIAPSPLCPGGGRGRGQWNFVESFAVAPVRPIVIHFAPYPCETHGHRHTKTHTLLHTWFFGTTRRVNARMVVRSKVGAFFHVLSRHSPAAFVL